MRKNEDSAALRLHALEKLVEDLHLASVVDKVLVRCVRRSGLGSVKQVRMVAALAELHDDVEQARLAFLLARHAIDRVDVALQERFVPLALHRRHPHVDVDLLLG